MAAITPWGEHMEMAKDMDAGSPDQLKRAIQYSGLGDYAKAQEYLDRMLETEPENHLLWYEKSKLPIVQEDNITVKSRSVSFSTYLRLPLAEKSDYLQRCGFEISEIPEVEGLLRAPNLIADQRVRYLNMAISCAPEKERAAYKSELDTLAAHAKEKRRFDIRAVILAGSIALLLAVLAVTLLNVYFDAWFFQNLILTIITLVVPYALSVVSMTLYTKARNNGNYTAFGFVCSLLALIISNLAIINALILFLTK